VSDRGARFCEAAILSARIEAERHLVRANHVTFYPARNLYYNASSFWEVVFM
jgi:hypothetical protein